MAFIFEVSKKEHLEKKDYWQNIRKSLGVEHRLQNELNDKERAADYDSSLYKGLVDQIQKAIAAYDPLDGDVSTAPKSLGQSRCHAIWQTTFRYADRPSSRWP